MIYLIKHDDADNYQHVTITLSSGYIFDLDKMYAQFKGSWRSHNYIAEYGEAYGFAKWLVDYYFFTEEQMKSISIP